MHGIFLNTNSTRTHFFNSLGKRDHGKVMVRLRTRNVKPFVKIGLFLIRTCNRTLYYRTYIVKTQFGKYYKTIPPIK